MRVLVCGAGRVGYGIARELAQERNAVTVVDTSQELIDKLTTELDVRGVVGHGSHPDILERAGAAEADMLIAVTYSDEVNMVACAVAHSLFNTPTKLARVRSRSYLDPAWRDVFASANLPIDVIISPELEVGRAILRRLETPGAFNTLPFAGGKVLVLGVSLGEDCPVANTTLNQIADLFPALKARVVGIKRDDRLFTPKPDDLVMVGDDIYIASDKDHVARALDIFGQDAARARRVILIGGGNVGIYVARELEKRGVRARVIEADRAQAETAAEALKKTVVLHGDGLNRDILREAGAQNAEVVISLTNDDKVNVLSAVLAKNEGVKRAFCLINDRSYEDLQESLGVDVFIDPRTTTVSTILQHVRRGRITGLYSIGDGEAEALEGVALETSPLVGRKWEQLDLPSGVTLAAVARGEQVLMPDEDLTIQEGDRVVVFAERELVGEVERLFRVSAAYF